MQGIEGAVGAGRAPQLPPKPAGMAQLLVANVYGVTLEEMRAATRRKARTALARQVAMYLSHTVFGMGVSEVAAAFGRNRSTAFHALRHIEEMRDDPALDRTLAYLETMLRGAAGDVA